MNFARPILRAMLGVIRLGLVRLKDAAGVLEIRNDDDSDYADLQAKKGIFSELQAAFDPPPAVGQALIAADVDGNLIFGNVAAGGSGMDGSPQAARAYSPTGAPLGVGLKSLDTLLRSRTIKASGGISNPIVALGTSSESDYRIREIGNVLYDPDDAVWPYRLTYTGWQTAKNNGDEKIHGAVSRDGKTWTKLGALISRNLEDPYVVKVNGVWYLYAEDKADGTGSNIRRYHSSDFLTWTDNGVITGIANCQSPVVWVEAGTWYMLYEKYPALPNDIRLATSSDGLVWTNSGANPVLELDDLSWADGAIVPDDILRIGATYVLFHHSYDTSDWRIGIATSTNLTDWTDHGYLDSTEVGAGRPATVMVAYDETLWFVYYDDETSDGIWRGDLVDPQLTIASGAITVTSDFYVIAAESGTSDDLATINGGRHGQMLVLKAASGDTITVKHDVGNVVFASGEDYELSGDTALLLFYDGDAAKWLSLGGGGGPAARSEWHVMTYGDVSDPGIVFADGAVVMVEVID